jgi:hypothetical protein
MPISWNLPKYQHETENLQPTDVPTPNNLAVINFLSSPKKSAKDATALSIH